MKLRVLISFLCLAVAVPVPALAETTVTLDDQTDLGITIYNDNLALVRDSRKISVPAGRSTLSILDVSAQIRAETALLEGNSFEVLEQYFDFDLLTPHKLLEKAVGQTVRLYRENPATGAETVETATILSTTGGTVLQIGDRIEVMGPLASIPGRIVFDKIPDNLRAKPTLSMVVLSDKPRDQTVTLNYLTGGLGWKADYVAYLNDDEDEISLQGWVTLTNNSGTTFNDADIQLVAGQVNQVTKSVGYAPQSLRMASVESDRVVQEEQLGEYHLYTLPHETSLANNQTKQISFIKAPKVSVRTFLQIKGQRWYYTRQFVGDGVVKALSYLTLKNENSAGLGKPLPKGIMRLYKADSRGTAQFLGEDRIDHTATGEEIRLLMGESFDVSAKRKQTSYSSSTRVVEGAKLTDYRSSYEIVVNNGKGEGVQVRIVEPIYGNWKVTRESQPHQKKDAFTAVWVVDVPAKGKTVLTYSVLTSATR